jgi:hypothetical protein
MQAVLSFLAHALRGMFCVLKWKRAKANLQGKKRSHSFKQKVKFLNLSSPSYLNGLEKFINDVYVICLVCRMCSIQSLGGKEIRWCKGPYFHYSSNYFRAPSVAV